MLMTAKAQCHSITGFYSCSPRSSTVKVGAMQSGGVYVINLATPLASPTISVADIIGKHHIPLCTLYRHFEIIFNISTRLLNIFLIEANQSNLYFSTTTLYDESFCSIPVSDPTPISRSELFRGFIGKGIIFLVSLTCL